MPLRITGRGGRPKRRAIIGAEALFNRPWFITRQALAGLVTAWQQADVTIAVEKGPSPGSLLAARLKAAGVALQHDMQGDDPDRAFPVTQDGIACIPAEGPLTKAAYWGTTSYSEIQQMAADALADSGVRGLVFCFDSPGGEACSDMLECAEYLAGVRGQKPMLAVADDDCFSAAYCLAAGVGPILVNSCGGVGSIGCWTAHVDTSKALEKAGIAVTYIFSGDRKVDGNPTQPLSDRARKDLQAEIDRIRDLFVQSVAKNRGATSARISATEAACYYGPAGIPLLGDRMGSVVDAVSILRAGLPELTVPAKQPAAALTAARRPGLIAPGAAADMWLATRSNIKPHAGLAVIAERLRLEETAMVARYGALVEARLMEFAGARASAVSKSLSSRRIDMLIVPYDGSQARLGSFSEVYERGCFAKGLDQDPRALVAHDDTLVLGRKSAGTARFFEDAAGVHVECDAPETTWADDLLVSMRRGDITQASAAFWILQQRWEVRNGEKVRVVEKALLRDGSVVSFAAYSTTTASALSASAARTELDAAQRRLDLMRPSFTDLERAEITLDQLRFAGLTELEIAQARLDRMVRGRPHTELERDQLKLDMLRRGGRPR